jgi:hypothetical protein
MGKNQKDDEYYKTFKDFDDFLKNVKIPAKKWQFFLNFTDEKSDCYGIATKSYHKAGYVEDETSKYRARDLWNSPLIQTLLSLYYQKIAKKRENRDLTVFDKTDNDLIWCIEEAKLARDYQAVRAATMDRAKLHGQLVEKHQVIDPYAEAAISKTKAIEAAKLAEQRLLIAPDDMPAVPMNAVFEQPQAIECQTELSNSDIESAILEQNQ